MSSLVKFLQAWYYRQIATAAVLFKRTDVAIENWEKIRVLRPNNVEALATVAHLRAEVGQKTEALALLEKAVSLEPDLSHHWFNLGFLQQSLERHDLALNSFEQAISLDVKLDRAHYGKALSLIKLERIDEAVVALKKNVELQPMSPYGFYQLAHAYNKLGEREGVAKTIRKLATFEPKVAHQLELETGVNVGVQYKFFKD
jgi:tetratricopeptide (TPR) repeat protein